MSLVSRARGPTGRPSNIRVGLQGLDAVAHSKFRAMAFASQYPDEKTWPEKRLRKKKDVARKKGGHRPPICYPSFLVISASDVLRTQHIKRGFYLQSAWLSQEPPCSQALQLW